MGARFDNKAVVITGASAGIGEACARQFAAEGASVALAARGKDRLAALVDELTVSGARAVAIPTDVASLEDCQRLVDTAVAELGGIDILVNNAGFNTRGPIEQFEPADLARVVQVNLAAPIALTRMALPHLARSGSGAVVNVASLAGRVPVYHEAVYSCTKFGLRVFSFCLADELRERGVKVAVVSPGPVDTGFIMDEIDTVPDAVMSQPVSTPGEIAELVLESALDGRRERVPRRLGRYLTTLGYLMPAVRRGLYPLMEQIGRRRKQRWRRRSQS